MKRGCFPTLILATIPGFMALAKIPPPRTITPAVASPHVSPRAPDSPIHPTFTYSPRLSRSIWREWNRGRK